MTVLQTIDGAFNSLATRIATLEPTLTETTSKLLQHGFNDIASDLDALAEKVTKFGAQIDSVEHDNSRQALVAEAEAKFAQIIASIKSAANSAEMETGRKIVDTLNVWKDDIRSI